jgi:hypothetical protein
MYMYMYMYMYVYVYVYVYVYMYMYMYVYVYDDYEIPIIIIIIVIFAHNNNHHHPIWRRGISNTFSTPPGDFFRCSQLEFLALAHPWDPRLALQHQYQYKTNDE